MPYKLQSMFYVSSTSVLTRSDWEISPYFLLIVHKGCYLIALHLHFLRYIVCTINLQLAYLHNFNSNVTIFTKKSNALALWMLTTLYAHKPHSRIFFSNFDFSIIYLTFKLSVHIIPWAVACTNLSARCFFARSSRDTLSTFRSRLS